MLIDTVSVHFGDVLDPRVACRTRFSIAEVLTSALVGFLCGQESIGELSALMRNMPTHLRNAVGMDSFPSGETIRRVLALVSPAALEEGLMAWAKQYRDRLGDGHIAIDGKKVRGSGGGNPNSAINVLSAWCVGARTIIGARVLDGDESEILAARELIKTLDIRGEVVTMDALHCQVDTVEAVTECGGDYILGVKANQGTLRNQVESWFEELHPVPSNLSSYDHYRISEKQRGREETRQVWATEIFPPTDEFSRWSGLKTLVRVESKRIISGLASYETRYFISSLPADAAKIGKRIRDHWGIENGLHFSLDVTHREDLDRTRDAEHVKNRALIRRIANDILGRAKEMKGSKRTKMVNCLLGAGYLEKVLSC